MTHDPKRPTVPDALPWVAEFLRQPGNEAGGVLHIVTDDGNYGDDFVASCLDEARAVGDERAELIASGLLAMSYTQRKKVVNMAHSLSHR